MGDGHDVDMMGERDWNSLELQLEKEHHIYHMILNSKQTDTCALASMRMSVW